MRDGSPALVIFYISLIIPLFHGQHKPNPWSTYNNPLLYLNTIIKYASKKIGTGLLLSVQARHGTIVLTLTNKNRCRCNWYMAFSRIVINTLSRSITITASLPTIIRIIFAIGRSNGTSSSYPQQHISAIYIQVSILLEDFTNCRRLSSLVADVAKRYIFTYIYIYRAREMITVLAGGLGSRPTP